MKIALCSVLKPLDDPRMAAKIGQTLSDQGNKVYVFGSGEKRFLKMIEGYDLIPIPFGHIDRKSVKRMLFQAFLFLKLFRIRPEVVVCHALELMPILVVGRWIVGYKLVYDIQENYFLNIKYQEVYQGWMKSILLRLVISMERFLAQYVDRFWVAEMSYFDELSFLGDRATYLPNVSIQLNPVVPHSFEDQSQLQFLVYGNISKEYGTLEAIQLFDHLKQVFIGSTLTIIGKCTDESYLQSIIRVSSDKQDVVLEVSSLGVSFPEIQEKVRQADMVIMSYQANRSINLCIPTKMYECISLGKAMLVRDNIYWSAFCKPYQSAFFYQSSLVNIKEEALSLKQFKFYDKVKEDTRISWADFRSDLQRDIQTLLVRT